MLEGREAESSEKPQKRRVAPTEQGSKGRILAISQDEKRGQHWRKTHCTLHPFQTPSTRSVSQAGDLRWGLSLPPASQSWGSPKTVPLQGPPPTALCSASSSLPAFLLLCSNCPNLGILGFLEVQKRELPTEVSRLCTISQLLPQGVV